MQFDASWYTGEEIGPKSTSSAEWPMLGTDIDGAGEMLALQLC